MSNWGNSTTQIGPCVVPPSSSTASPAANIGDLVQPFNHDTLLQHLIKLISNARESWTYGIFWKSSILNGTDSSQLQWGGGYYEGGMDNIKTTPSVTSFEEQEYRKKVLLELSLFISNGTLSIDEDEDVTDTEWFFLISMTHSFGKGNALPCLAMSSNQPVWTAGPEQLLTSHCQHTQKGQEFGLQTIVYIPCTNGVVELGSTELFLPSINIMNEVRGLFDFFKSQHDFTPMEANLTIPCPNGAVELGSPELFFPSFDFMNEFRELFGFIKSQPDLTPMEVDQTDGRDNDPSKAKRKTTEISLPREVIEKQFGKTIIQAAKALYVSESTFKRKLRKLGIQKWPGPKFVKRNTMDLSIIQINTIEENRVAIQDPSMVNIIRNLLTIKAEYADDMIKFCLPTSQATFVTVEKEISMKFKLILGTYKLKYLDEDGDWISLRSDLEMSDCIKSSTKLDRIVIRLRVVPSP